MNYNYTLYGGIWHDSLELTVLTHIPLVIYVYMSIAFLKPKNKMALLSYCKSREKKVEEANICTGSTCLEFDLWTPCTLTNI
jgi:hypothetical protein